jgi:hypothetical protein
MAPRSRYVSDPGREFATCARAGGKEARALAGRLTGSLESAFGDLEMSGLAIGDLETGDLETGIAEGAAARPQMDTGVGHAHDLLENTTRPEEAEETVEVRGSTFYGRIIVHRS